jgi:DNA recombination protein RmuC
MTDLFIYLLVSVLGIALGLFIGRLQSKAKYGAIDNEKNILIESSNELRNELKIIQKEKEGLLLENTRQEAELKNLNIRLEENQKDIEKLQEKFTKEFENLANRILDEKSEKFTKKNKENIETILNPLKEKIKEFEGKVDKTHKESIDYHAALRQQISGLKELNHQMSKETLNLTKALKGDSKAQGDWGETQLELLLEKANLIKDIHYSTQGGFRDEDGKLKKPDLIINLPDNRHLIIDSKVSLTNYEAYYSEEDDQAKTVQLKLHIESIRKHIKELSDKKYESLYAINSPDYVMMFVPIEPALMLALGNVKDLYLEALDKNVVLVSSSTLLATLSTVSSMWRQENQKRNVLEIARQAGALYDKFNGLLVDLVDVGKRLNSAKIGYEGAMNKLSTGRGNLITSVEKLKKLGAKTQKSIPQNLLDRAQDEK